MSLKDYGISPLCCVSICSFTLQCCLEYTSFKLQTKQDKGMIFLIENNNRGGISSVLGDRDTKADENKKKFNIEATNFLSSLKVTSFTI